ncbi:neurotransmitter:Na+ symporter, NSS family [Lachnospiraceae bacterium XBB2008]|nr:neurotransmitter:Na+ symporter, NSS family [Lachnospiraceae bacterium XBB2008]
MDENNRNSFTGSIGFVLAAAGSAVGLGNIWRFPYLAARDGGGLFLLVYLVLALTFGYTLLTSEVALGRLTKQSPLTAYGKLSKKFKPLGVMACIVPMLIMPYYCVIGGWVVKYFLAFITGSGFTTAQDGYFGGFITETTSPVGMTIVFLFLTMIVVLGGVDKGIERFSKVIMPLLVILIIVISVFTLTISDTDELGNVRTGLEGLKVLVIPNFEGLTLSRFFSVLMDAMGQLFYSLSIAMGIMVAYGSYMRDEDNMSHSVGQIEIFDTGIAFLAGVMIIPSVYVFMGREGMEASGPGLMFVSLPRVFERMGSVGNYIGTLFFALVLFAALTSSVSILEAIVSSFMDKFNMSRVAAVITEGVIALALGLLVCLGYNKLYFEVELPNGAIAQILDIMDYVSNNLLMPIVAILTCILVGWIVGPETVIGEATKNGEKFRRRGLFIVMVKFIAPVMLLILLLKAFGIL